MKNLITRLYERFVNRIFIPKGASFYVYNINGESVDVKIGEPAPIIGQYVERGVTYYGPAYKS